MASPSLGLAAAMSFGPYVVPIVLNSCNVDINLATRASLAAQGQSTALIGYVPSNNAKSGFQTTIKIPYRQGSTSSAAIINALLAVAGLDLTLQFGSAGGVKIASCIPFNFSVNGTEGQDITLQVQYESVNFATVGATVSAPSGFDLVWGFHDVQSHTAISGTTYVKVNMFSLKGTRVRAAYVGNSPVGLAQNLGIAYTEINHEAEVLKIGDGEMTTFNGSGPPTYTQQQADTFTILQQVNPPTGQGTPDIMTLAANSCFYDSAPKNMGSESEWVREHFVEKAAHGGFAITSG